MTTRIPDCAIRRCSFRQAVAWLYEQVNLPMPEVRR